MKALGLPAGDLRKPLTNLDGEALAKGVRIVQELGLDKTYGYKVKADLGRRGVSATSSPVVPAKAGTQNRPPLGFVRHWVPAFAGTNESCGAAPCSDDAR